MEKNFCPVYSLLFASPIFKKYLITKLKLEKNTFLCGEAIGSALEGSWGTLSPVYRRLGNTTGKCQSFSKNLWTLFDRVWIHVLGNAEIFLAIPWTHFLVFFSELFIGYVTIKNLREKLSGNRKSEEQLLRLSRFGKYKTYFIAFLRRFLFSIIEDATK